MDDLRLCRPAGPLGQPIEVHPVIDSTNRRALEWASTGAPHGATVLADHQTAGRGRLGRHWVDARGQALLFSVVLRPLVKTELLGLLPLAAGLAVAEAIEPVVTGHAVELKWPNDVIINGQKLGGILAESQVTGENAVVVLGIGLNVLAEPLLPEPRETTSLGRFTPRDIDRCSILESVLSQLARWLTRLDRGATQEIVAAFTERMVLKGETVRVEVSRADPLLGRIVGVDESGALMLEVDSVVRPLTAGDVSLRGQLQAQT